MLMLTGSFHTCQVLFCWSPQRQVLPSSRPASLPVFPAGGSPEPATAPSSLACRPPHRTFCPHVLGGLCSPTSLHCWVQPCYSGTQVPPPAWNHDLVLLSASAWGHTLPRWEPQEVQGEAQRPAPGEGQCQAPAHAAGCPAGKQPGKGDRAAALRHRLSSCSARCSFGAGISSPLFGRDPSSADGRCLFPSAPSPHAAPTRRTLSAGLPPAQLLSAATEPCRKGSASSPCSTGPLALLLHSTHPFCSQAGHARRDEGQKVTAGFGTKSCCQAPKTDPGPKARPTGGPAGLRHAAGTWGEAQRGEALPAGEQKATRACRAPPRWGCTEGQSSAWGGEPRRQTRALSGDHTMQELQA